MPDFVALAALVGLGMLVWDCVEVGRNDAANLVNAVFGARVLKRRTAVRIAAVAVVLGAICSSPVMETARKGIFDPRVVTVQSAMAIYVSVYFVDTVLLYAFSGFGMPVSTTACLVFSLLGAAFVLSGPENVMWSKVGEVIAGIVMSIGITGLASFLIMRVFRGAIRDKTKDRETILLHGPWIAGAMFTWLTWFMVFKGLKNVAIVQWIRGEVFELYGEWFVLLVLWGFFTLLTHLLLVVTHRHFYQYLFPVTAVCGMVCMAFAFGQNDLANAASPGLAGLTLWRHGGAATNLADVATQIPLPVWGLLACGLLMAAGMFTTYAQRVTRAEVNTGSQFDHVALYAPGWCRALARRVLGIHRDAVPLAPEPELTDDGKKVHYDALRASVITGVGASVIAFASGRGLPVSTTYVAFAAVLGTGFSDRVFVRGDADLKVGRAIWVVTCWFLAPVIAAVSCGGVAMTVYKFGAPGLAICLGLNLTLRRYFRQRADAHERRYHPVEPKLGEPALIATPQLADPQ
ncbi:MAG: inorganic phosphate transporter [Pirellulaceae bacterium]|jgi:phosphate/sulfate permease|nr:inorganic phosphate transporter [Pirellulaceae bacterium]